MWHFEKKMRTVWESMMNWWCGTTARKHVRTHFKLLHKQSKHTTHYQTVCATACVSQTVWPVVGLLMQATQLYSHCASWQWALTAGAVMSFSTSVPYIIRKVRIKLHTNLREHVDEAACRTSITGRISMFVFENLRIPSGCSKMCTGCSAHQHAPPWQRSCTAC